MMDSDFPLVMARSVHFASCLLIVSVWWFDFLVMRGISEGSPASWTKIRRWLILAALPLAALSGAAWFALIVMRMSGLPFHQAMQPHILGMVWRDTKFGRLWQWRTIFFAALILALL